MMTYVAYMVVVLFGFSRIIKGVFVLMGLMRRCQLRDEFRIKRSRKISASEDHPLHYGFGHIDDYRCALGSDLLYLSNRRQSANYISKNRNDK